MLSVEYVKLDLLLVFTTGLVAFGADEDSLPVLSTPPPTEEEFRFSAALFLASFMDFASNGKGCCSCLMAEDGMNLAPETLLLVCTEATMIQPSVVVDVGAFVLAVVLLLPLLMVSSMTGLVVEGTFRCLVVETVGIVVITGSS